MSAKFINQTLFTGCNCFKKVSNVETMNRAG